MHVLYINTGLSFLTGEYSPFHGLEKGAVLQEARVFNDPQLDPRRCSQVIICFSHSTPHKQCFQELVNNIHAFFITFFQVITKLLYLLNQGESFTKVNFTPYVSIQYTKKSEKRTIKMHLMWCIYQMIQRLCGLPEFPICP